MEEAFQCPIPKSDTIAFRLPKTASFVVAKEDWEKLKSLQKENRDGRGKLRRRFPPGTWQKCFLEGLKVSNPYCTFHIVTHNVSVSEQRDTKGPAFTTAVQCGRDECGITGNLVMPSAKSRIVHVKYSGKMRHDRKYEKARPIRKFIRDELKQRMRDGASAQSLYEQGQDFGSHSVAGEAGQMGTSSHTIRQIGYESRAEARRDNDEGKSLLKIRDEIVAKELEDEAERERKDQEREKMMKDNELSDSDTELFVPKKKQAKKQECVRGYIQYVALSPGLKLHLYTRLGVRLYHRIARHDTLYIDATGTVVRDFSDKRVYVYQLACAHPIENQPSIILAELVSSVHSTEHIVNFILSLKKSERELYGKEVEVKLIMMDRSAALFKAAAYAWNLDRPKIYMERCFRIATGAATSEDASRYKTTAIIRACLAHALKSIKMRAKTDYRRSGEAVAVLMYSMSCYFRCKVLTDCREILVNLLLVLENERTNPVVERALEKLCDIANGLTDEEKNAAVKPESICSDMASGEEEHRGGKKDEEEDIFDHCNESESWMDQIRLETESRMESVSDEDELNAEKNLYFGPKMAKYILKNIIPQTPFITKIMEGDCGRHGKGTVYQSMTDWYVQFSKTVPKKSRSVLDPLSTTGIIEQRFNVDKGLIHPRSARSDEYVQRQYLHTVANQKIACRRDFHLRQFTRDESSGSESGSKLAEERWARGRKRKTSGEEVKQNKRRMGFYSRPPKSDAIYHKNDGESKKEKTKPEVKCKETLFTSVNKRCEEVDDEDEFPPVPLMSVKRRGIPNKFQNCWLNSTLQALLSTVHLCKFISSYTGIAPVLKLMAATSTGGNKITCVPFDVVDEALTGFPVEWKGKQQDALMTVEHVSTLVDLSMDVCRLTECQCGYRKESVEKRTYITIQPDSNSVQLGLNGAFSEERLTSCSVCKIHDVLSRERIQREPVVLIVHVNRIIKHGHDFRKHSYMLAVNSSVNLVGTTGAPVEYTLKSVVLHEGESVSSGHYTTIAYDGCSPVLYNDQVVRLATQSDMDQMERCAYIIVYERTNANKQVDSLNCSPVDYHCLQRNQWLNSDVVNGYLSLVQGISANVVLSTYVYADIAAKRELSRWRSRYNLECAASILVPVNRNHHWMLFEINRNQKVVKIFDSLGGKHYMTAVLVTAAIFPNIEVSSWSIQHVVQTAVQQDGTECGVYLLYFARSVMSGRTVWTKPGINCPKIRQLVFEEMQKKQLEPAETWFRAVLTP